MLGKPWLAERIAFVACHLGLAHPNAGLITFQGHRCVESGNFLQRPLKDVPVVKGCAHINLRIVHQLAFGASCFMRADQFTAVAVGISALHRKVSLIGLAHGVICWSSTIWYLA